MTESRRFVLLEHRWQGVHFDLMLEENGVLKTWKLAAPLRPGEQRTEASFDHRISYLDYEGPISGDRGEVTRLDSGVYVGEVTSELVDVRLQGQHLIGHLRIQHQLERDLRLTWQPQPRPNQS